MSETVPSFIPSTMVMAMLMVLVAATAFANASLLCDKNSYADGDPFGDSVDYVLADLMNVTPSQKGYSYSTESPYPTSTAYVHATCGQWLSNSECADSMASARATLSRGCNQSIGGQVGLVGCTMRYENYPFA